MEELIQSFWAWVSGNFIAVLGGVAALFEKTASLIANYEKIRDFFKGSSKERSSEKAVENLAHANRLMVEILQSYTGKQLKSSGKANDDVTDTSKEEITSAISRLLSAGEGARKRAGEKLTAIPPDPEGALAELKSLAAQQEETLSDAAETYREIGAIAFLTDTQDALRAWKRVAELKPKDPDAHNQVGLLYYRIGDYQHANAEYKRVRDIGIETGDDGTLAIAYSNLGIIERLRGNLEAAEEYARKSSALSEEHKCIGGVANQDCNIGNIYFDRRDFDAALSYYQKSLSGYDSLDESKAFYKIEGMARVHKNIGNLEMERGNRDAAINHWHKSYILYAEVDMAAEMELVAAQLRDAGAPVDGDAE